jgi:hypothetical protein
MIEVLLYIFLALVGGYAVVRLLTAAYYKSRSDYERTKPNGR